MRVLLILLTFVLPSLPNAAQAQASAMQIDPIAGVTMIQKDVGPERWTILYDSQRGTYIGNVLKDDDSTPSFVWCETVGETSQELTFRCSGADPCGSPVCPGRRADGGGDWVLIDPAFRLPRSFFEPHGSPPAGGAAHVRSTSVDAPSSLQVDPTGTAVMIQKDVGAERWTIVYDQERKTYLGNVVKDDGSPPSFVSCETRAEAEDEVTFRCWGANACTSTRCPGRRADGTPDWQLVTEDFRVPWSFLRPRRKPVPPGELDPDFAEGGVQQIAFGKHVDVYRRGVDARPDGSVRLLVTTSQADESDFLLVGLRPDGRPDSAVGPLGMQPLFGETPGFDPLDMRFASDGSILAAGDLEGSGSVLARFSSTGILDESFGQRGFAPLRLSRVYDIVTVPAGQILLVGALPSDPKTQSVVSALELLSGDGSPVTGFGEDAIARAPPPQFGAEFFRFVLVAAAVTEERILVAAYHTAPISRTGAIVAYDLEGAPDPTFGDGGFVFSGPTGASAIVTTERDDAIILTRFELRRHHSDGTYDDTFHPPLLGSSSGIANIVRADDGRIFAAGSAFVPDPERLHCQAVSSDGQCDRAAIVAQSFLDDGTPDPTFGDGGTVVIEPLSGGGAQGTGAQTLALAAGDRLLLAGAVCLHYGDCNLAVIQYGR